MDCFVAQNAPRKDELVYRHRERVKRVWRSSRWACQERKGLLQNTFEIDGKTTQIQTI